ncbi:MAG TPA: glycosyltransferase [Solirubrobacteraceae bacterium]|jgi:sterol 3beta-glucosyltransferase
MRITFSTLGTRGDHWLSIALAAHLIDRDHEVTVAASAGCERLGAASGARAAVLPSNATAFYATKDGKRALNAGGIKAVTETDRYYARFRDELDTAMLAACEGAEALVATHLTYTRMVAIADLLRVPVTILWPLPLLPTRAYSTPALDLPVRTSSLRLLTHKAVAWEWERKTAKDIAAFRRTIGAPADTRSALGRICDARAVQLLPFSPSVLPRAFDWGPEKLMTGWWRLPDHVRADAGETISADTSAWIDAGAPPFYLGLGSMPVIEPKPLLDDVIAVTAELGIRALVDAKIAGDGTGLPTHLHSVGATNHDTLFPRCAGVMHHGGAGSTAASTRAGVPTMVCSVAFDQHFWGKRLRDLGAGSHCYFKKLDREQLRTGLARLRDPAVIEGAARLGAAIEAEGDGTAIAAHALEDWLVTAEPLPTAATRGRSARLATAV